ncbi:MAG: hypothetical protein AAGF47_00015 [Planctomycetota bacterium]
MDTLGIAQESPSIVLIPASSRGPANPFGRFSHDNPADPAGWPEAWPTREPRGRLIVWAGWLDDDADPANGRFPRDLRTWTEPGWTALREGLAELRPAAHAAAGSICLRPAAGCVLGDPQACLTFFRESSAAGLELLVDLPSMLTPEMMPELPDHAARAFDALGTLDAAVGSVLAAPVITDGRVGLQPLTDQPGTAELVLDAWRGSPLADRPALLIDPRDAALLA